MTDAPALPPAPQGLSFLKAIKPVAESGSPKSIAVIGMFKTGKTTLGASASRIPEILSAGKKTLILEAESGTASIAEDYPDVDMLSVSNLREFNGAVSQLITRPHDYGVLILDTMDKFQEYYVKAIIDTAADSRKAWGQAKTWMIDTMWELHKSNMLVIVLFHEEDVKNDKTGAVKTHFKLQGNAKNDLGQVFDIIGRLTVEKDADGVKHRVLQLGPEDGQVTGNRYESKLPDRMTDPTIPKIFELVNAKKPTTGN